MMKSISVLVDLLATDPPCKIRGEMADLAQKRFTHKETCGRNSAALWRHVQLWWSYSCILPKHAVLLLDWSALQFMEGWHCFLKRDVPKKWWEKTLRVRDVNPSVPTRASWSMSMWVFKQTALSGWISTKIKNFFATSFFSTHRQPTSPCIFDPRAPFMKFLGYPFLKRCLTWKSRSQILENWPCFGCSRSQW